MLQIPEMAVYIKLTESARPLGSAIEHSCANFQFKGLTVTPKMHWTEIGHSFLAYVFRNEDLPTREAV